MNVFAWIMNFIAVFAVLQSSAKRPNAPSEFSMPKKAKAVEFYIASGYKLNEARRRYNDHFNHHERMRTRHESHRKTVDAPHAASISSWFQNFIKTGCVDIKHAGKKPHAVTAENKDILKQLINTQPITSQRKLSNQTGKAFLVHLRFII